MSADSAIARAVTLLLLIPCLGCAPRQAAVAETTGDATAAGAAARAAAHAWLAIIDAGDYRVSWEAAARSAQRAFPVAEWIGFIGGLRNRLGPLEARTVVDVRVGVHPPGAPDGEYVVVEYRSRFRHDPAAVEEVIVTLQQGSWRGFGYVVRAAHDSF